MQFFDAGTVAAGTPKANHVTFYRTVHGSVFGYARVHSRLVALSEKRASYGKDVLDLLFYHDLAHGLVHNVHDFFRAANQTPQTFNSLYVGRQDDRGVHQRPDSEDMREATLEPVLSRVLHGERAPNAQDAKMLTLLDAWRSHGSSRLDRTDASGIGKITDPGAAIMDTAWPLLANAWASDVLGAGLSAQLATFVSPFDQPPGGQYTGWHIYMDKDLRTLLGDRVRGKFAVRYCGGGSLKRCRAELWAAVDQAGKQLAATQGADPAAWRSDATA